MSRPYEQLFHSFQELWTNRRFDEDEDVLQVMKRTIATDLKDELSHPRARSTPDKKFTQAVKRITQADIPVEDQLQIIILYLEQLELL